MREQSGIAIEMDTNEQIEHFAGDIDKLVDRYRSEYELAYASVVGVLQVKIHLLCAEAQEREDEA